MNISKDIYVKNIFKRYLAVTVSLFISAICFNLLLKPINLVAGGTSGLSIIVEHLFEIPTSNTISFIYIITFILSLILLGKDSFVGLLYASVLYPILVNLTNNITDVLVINHNDILLITIFAGILSGISSGLIYKNGFPSSGMGVIAPILNKYFKLSISSVNFVINTIIVLLGGYYFGIDMILYAIILLYLNTHICNTIILGVSNNKALFIRSNKIEKIKTFLYQEHHIKATIIKAYGGYSLEKGDLLLVVVPSLKYNYIVKKLKNIDKNIFFVTCNSYELNYKTNFNDV